nr:MAG TPA: hypothetical protein [Caudoviricetes sp.]
MKLSSSLIKSPSEHPSMSEIKGLILFINRSKE